MAKVFVQTDVYNFFFSEFMKDDYDRDIVLNCVQNFDEEYLSRKYKTGYNVIGLALHKEDKSVIEALFEKFDSNYFHKAYIRNERKYSLVYAIEIQNIDIVKLMIGNLEKVEYPLNFGFTALGMAIEKQNVDIVQLLLQNADINITKRYGVCYFIFTKNQ
eukprot:TRINITY_DN2130_c0_g1_i2.p1 TRINITY_DN2130_c0_g1~~TRINITY_DN2130_c0_g1_i2.p1  ORF type:complete len:160 (+),score=33.78 TRINITY_DN2130_c0_g1_i2:32-511(+)